jgi:hypothetical protein
MERGAMATGTNMITANVPDTSGPEQLKRSIDSLQRLYTIVVGLAVTEALRNFLAPASPPPNPWWANWLSPTSTLDGRLIKFGIQYDF